MNNKRFGTVLVLAILLCILVAHSAAAGAVSAQVPAGVGIQPNGPEVEPNDDFETAEAIGWGAKRGGEIDRPGDVDFFTFTAKPLDLLSVDWRPWNSPIQGVLTLYDEMGTVLVENLCSGNGPCLQYEFPPDFGYSNYEYFLRVANAGPGGGLNYTYYFTLDFAGKADHNEPNDTFAEATPLVFDEGKLGAIWPIESDADTFMFSGAAGDAIEVNIGCHDYCDATWELFDAGSNSIGTFEQGEYAVLPANGVYYVRPKTYWDYVYNIMVHRMRDIEPNNTPAEALALANRDTADGLLESCDDVDYFTFTGQAGDDFRIEQHEYDAHVQVLDAAQHLIADGDGWDISVTLPTPGVYYLRLSQPAECNGPLHYRNELIFVGNNEPNDLPAQARPLAFDEAFGGLVDCADVDYFTFNGQAGTRVALEPLDYSPVRLQVLDAALNTVAEDAYNGGSSLVFVVPDSGLYYVKVSYDRWCEEGGRFPYQLRLDSLVRPVYLSLNKGGVLQGIHFTAGDILTYHPDSGKLEMLVDMSDLGLSGNLTSLIMSGYFPAHTDICLGFAGAYTRPALGTVTPHDLIKLKPTSLGPNTAGALSFAFDGSDVGLTTSGERLDAIGGHYACTDTMMVSTMGQAQVPYGLGTLTAQDEDALDFRSWRSGYGGPDTSGQWQPDLDGSANGLGALDIVALDTSWDGASRGNVRWLVFDRAVTLDGIAFAPGDIAECTDAYYDGDDLCDAFTKFLDASDAGFGSYRIDAFEVGDLE